MDWGAYGATIATSYATGSVSGSSYIGGLVGNEVGPIPTDNNYWDTQTIGQSVNEGGTGKTTAQMKTLSTFSGWSLSDNGINTTWKLSSGVYPTLLNRYISSITLATALQSLNSGS